MARQYNTARSRTRRQPVAEQPASTGLAPVAALKLLSGPAPTPPDIPACVRQDLIEQAAYFRAEQRGFEPGHELDDWLEAEREVDATIRERYR